MPFGCLRGRATLVASRPRADGLLHDDEQGGEDQAEHDVAGPVEVQHDNADPVHGPGGYGDPKSPRAVLVQPRRAERGGEQK